MRPEALLVGAVIAVGVLHTLVPDHWAPITIIARQRRWSLVQTARAAAGAGLGHTLSTLALAVVVWSAGAVFAQRFGRAIDLAAGIALTGFGLWIAVASWREARDADVHDCVPHAHAGGERTALLLILGSSPMIEGIPAFFAASRYGYGQLALMALCFAISTIATYVVLCVASTAGLARMNFGLFERYGEVLSGGFIAVLGVAFLVWQR